jgi:uncharacterized protein involved in exopolysaccharide biosynthesis
MAHEPVRRDRTGGVRSGNGNGNGHGNNNATNNNANLYNGGPTYPSTASEQIRDVLHIIFKRKRLILALFAAVALPGILTTALRKPTYIASAKVMISTQRTDPTVQPTDLTRLEHIQLNESLVNSEVHVIGSRDLLDEVVRKLAVSHTGSGLPTSDGERPFGQQVLQLARRLSITPVKSSNVIRIDYRSPEQMTAARIVNRVVDEYLAYHAEVHGNARLPRFYDEQRRSLEGELRKAEQRLIAFTNREGVVAPREEMTSTMRMTSELRAVMRDVSTKISGVEERIRAIREQIATQPEVVKRSQSLQVNPVITQLGAHLVDRQIDRIALLRKYTEEDRMLRDNAEEIEELREQLEQESRDRPTVVANQEYRANPLRQYRLQELLERESELRDLRARRAALDEEVNRASARLMMLSGKSVEYERLEQEVKHQRETYDLYVRREQEARISRAMDEQKLVNVEVVERPALPLPRAGAQRVTVLLSVIAGLLVGVGGAFGREYMSRSLRSEYDVGRHLGLPLLASVGDYPKA